MKERIRELSQHLRDTSSLLSTFLDSGCLPSSSSSIGSGSEEDATRISTTTSSTTTSRSHATTGAGGPMGGLGLSRAVNITNRIGNAVARARTMISTSATRGVYSRLSQRERLRSSASSVVDNNNRSKRRKIDTDNVKKVFEFVLVNISVGSESWAITDDNILLRGLVDVTTTSKEDEIRAEIGKAIRSKYPMITDSDFEFLRATRRKLSKPVNIQSYDYPHVKLLAGQGSIYLKLKDGFDCLLVEDENAFDNDEGTYGTLKYILTIFQK